SDGLHLVFLSADFRIYQTDRTTRTDAWSTPTIVGGVDNFVVNGGVDISLDGLRVYVRRRAKLHTATRTDVMAAFDTVTDLAVGLDVGSLGISPDERELFFNPSTNYELHRITRNDPSLDFDISTDDMLLQDARNPDVSPDSRTLLYSVDGVLTLMHRDCP